VAHRDIETVTLDRDTYHQKDVLALRFAELIYNGQWYSPLRRHLQAFVDSTQEHVSGTVRLHLHRGALSVTGRRSDRSLYDKELATFEKDQLYDQKDATGFINLWGLPIRMEALRARRLKKRGERS
jgi:argininosuccinate synthase